MNRPQPERFQEFFEDDRYVRLKNHLYNYLLRKNAVEKNVEPDHPGFTLDLGSGISPMITRRRRMIYADASWLALRMLRQTQVDGWYVVADGMQLPFKSGAFAYTVCSEVLEHMADDREAVRELARVLAPTGYLVVTFPHRRCYFANDDRWVQHVRRYELAEMEDRLQAAGLHPVVIQKVLGPLEKVTMCVVVFCFSLMKNFRPRREQKPHHARLMEMLIVLFKWSNRCYAGLVWLDAKIMPRALAATLLIKAKKREAAFLNTKK